MCDLWWLVPGKLAGMAFPQQKSDYDTVSGNFGLIVCLHETTPEFRPMPPCNFIHFPVPDYCAPHTMEMERMAMVVTAAVECISKGKAVLCHCAAGRGRTSMALACITAATRDATSFAQVALILNEFLSCKAISMVNKARSFCKKESSRVLTNAQEVYKKIFLNLHAHLRMFTDIRSRFFCLLEH